MIEDRPETPRAGRPEPVSRPSFCRCCHNACPVDVTIEDGRAVSLAGSRGNDVYDGYTCVKGRAWPEQHNHPDRLTTSMRREDDGSFRAIAAAQLVTEVGARLRAIIDESGPGAVAVYTGTKATGNPTAALLCRPFLSAIGSNMFFTADTIDQPGKAVARALHGTWLGGPQAFDEPDVGLIVGANPLVSYCGGLPSGNPGRQLQRWTARGFTLIVIDPRRTDVAKRATLHLQARPGEDVGILAGMLRVIIEERLYDADFVAEEVDGLAELRRAVAPYAVERVVRRAGIDGEDLVAAARSFAAARRGYAVASTGANMSGHGTLVEYLVLALNTLCGRWRRAGERVVTPTALPVAHPRAQASGPVPAFGLGEPMTATGATASAAGLPTAALPDQILHGGQDRVRALITVGGNPVAAWPDQLKTIRAMRHLDLLVQVDVRMSATARLADYVVAPLMGLEMPSVTRTPESMAQYGVAYGGYATPWGQWTDAVVAPAPGADLIAEWQLFYGLARELGVPLLIETPFGESRLASLDMTTEPTTEELLELACAGSRVPLRSLREHPEGSEFPFPERRVLPKEPGWTGRLDVGHPRMMADLAELAVLADEAVLAAPRPAADLPFRLIPRRVQHVYNSSGHGLAGVRRAPYNPAFLHPADLERLGLVDGSIVRVRSRTASILAIAKPDPTLREGLVSMSHAFGEGPERDGEFREIGSSTARLVSSEHDIAPYTWQPLMSDIPVAIVEAGVV